MTECRSGGGARSRARSPAGARGSRSRCRSRWSRFCLLHWARGGKLSPEGAVAPPSHPASVAELCRRLLVSAAVLGGLGRLCHLLAPSGAWPRACGFRDRLAGSENLADLAPVGSGCCRGGEACPGQGPRTGSPAQLSAQQSSAERGGPRGDPGGMRPGPALPGSRGGPCVNVTTAWRGTVGAQRR